jgi:hypothetical protein
MTEPEETVVNPVTNPSFSGLQEAQPLPSMSDFVDYSNANFAGATPPQGSSGIFGEAFSDVFQSYYQRAEDKALSVVSAMRATVHLSLPPDPVTRGYSVTFDMFFLRAIQSFPPPSAYSDLTSWYKKSQPLFESFFDKYGTSIVVEASLGGMVEVYSSWGTPLLVMGFDRPKLAANALIDFTTATGLGGHTDAQDPLYTKYTDVNKVTCIGGDPSKCNKEGLQGGAWVDSTATAPRLLHYKLLAQSELLNDMDPDIKQTLEDATSMYIQGKQKQWGAVDKCPKSCNGRGECAKGGDKCECGCADGRMCSVADAAASVCAGITWQHGGCQFDINGTLAQALKAGDSKQAGTWQCAGGLYTGTLSCSRQSDGRLVARKVITDPNGDPPISHAGKPVASGCSVANNPNNGKAVGSCCFPK